MKYSIADLEKLSGVQSHTIRIWEQRYKALTPHRSAGNTRYYDDEQLRRLLNLVTLNHSGIKISQACALSNEEINNIIQQTIDQSRATTGEFEHYINQLLIDGLAYNELAFNKVLSQAIKQHHLNKAYEQVIYPLLNRLGMMWQQDKICPAQEHFLSNLIRQKLFSVIDSLPSGNPSGSTWLLFLPEDEGHDIGLLFAKYVLRNAQQKVIYLGSHVPISSLKLAINDNQVDHLLFFMTHARLVTDAQHYINELALQFTSGRIHLAGNSRLLSEIKLPDHVSWFKSIGDLEKYIHPIS
ncbi:DNA-binding transcriptional MerR regulator [Pedobacter sp. CAN_A7]|uniref:MerR family transcriptional regulator n=1 Tax=Pedobacter sp. CAN_A7 TaxID=2787722 RepID=UPI0018C9438E